MAPFYGIEIRSAAPCSCLSFRTNRQYLSGMHHRNNAPKPISLIAAATHAALVRCVGWASLCPRVRANVACSNLGSFPFNQRVGTGCPPYFLTDVRRRAGCATINSTAVQIAALWCARCRIEFRGLNMRSIGVAKWVAMWASVLGVSCATATGLNDTGFTTCADASGATVSCTAATAVKAQDARTGRDAAAAAALTKTGAGATGFDFTKMSNGASGTPSKAIAATVALGTGPDDWGCTYDNTTGLMWEVKTTSVLRSQKHTYSWYSTNAATNGGYIGTAGGGTCATAGHCDTEKFLQDVNAVGMCGRSDWRMPTIGELKSLVWLGARPTIAGGYFPNTVANLYWSGSPVAGISALAWSVFFLSGSSGYDLRNYNLYVRLVRVGR